MSETNPNFDISLALKQITAGRCCIIIKRSSPTEVQQLTASKIPRLDPEIIDYSASDDDEDASVKNTSTFTKIVETKNGNKTDMDNCDTPLFESPQTYESSACSTCVSDNEDDINSTFEYQCVPSQKSNIKIIKKCKKKKPSELNNNELIIKLQALEEAIPTSEKMSPKESQQPQKNDCKPSVETDMKKNETLHWMKINVDNHNGNFIFKPDSPPVVSNKNIFDSTTQKRGRPKKRSIQKIKKVKTKKNINCYDNLISSPKSIQEDVKVHIKTSEVAQKISNPSVSYPAINSLLISTVKQSESQHRSETSENNVNYLPTDISNQSNLLSKISGNPELTVTNSCASSSVVISSIAEEICKVSPLKLRISSDVSITPLEEVKKMVTVKGEPRSTSPTACVSPSNKTPSQPINVENYFIKPESHSSPSVKSKYGNHSYLSLNNADQVNKKIKLISETNESCSTSPLADIHASSNIIISSTIINDSKSIDRQATESVNKCNTTDISYPVVEVENRSTHVTATNTNMKLSLNNTKTGNGSHNQDLRSLAPVFSVISHPIVKSENSSTSHVVINANNAKLPKIKSNLTNQNIKSSDSLLDVGVTKSTANHLIKTESRCISPPVATDKNVNSHAINVGSTKPILSFSITKQSLTSSNLPTNINVHKTDTSNTTSHSFVKTETRCTSPTKNPVLPVNLEKTSICQPHADTTTNSSSYLSDPHQTSMNLLPAVKIKNKNKVANKMIGNGIKPDSNLASTFPKPEKNLETTPLRSENNSVMTPPLINIKQDRTDDVETGCCQSAAEAYQVKDTKIESDAPEISKLKIGLIKVKSSKALGIVNPDFSFESKIAPSVVNNSLNDNAVLSTTNIKPLLPMITSHRNLTDTIPQLFQDHMSYNSTGIDSAKNSGISKNSAVVHHLMDSTSPFSTSTTIERTVDTVQQQLSQVQSLDSKSTGRTRNTEFHNLVNMLKELYTDTYLFNRKKKLSKKLYIERKNEMYPRFRAMFINWLRHIRKIHKTPKDYELESRRFFFKLLSNVDAELDENTRDYRPKKVILHEIFGDKDVLDFFPETSFHSVLLSIAKDSESKKNLIATNDKLSNQTITWSDIQPFKDNQRSPLELKVHTVQNLVQGPRRLSTELYSNNMNQISTQFVPTTSAIINNTLPPSAPNINSRISTATLENQTNRNVSILRTDPRIANASQIQYFSNPSVYQLQPHVQQQVEMLDNQLNLQQLQTPNSNNQYIIASSPKLIPQYYNQTSTSMLPTLSRRQYSVSQSATYPESRYTAHQMANTPFIQSSPQVNNTTPASLMLQQQFLDNQLFINQSRDPRRNVNLEQNSVQRESVINSRSNLIDLSVQSQYTESTSGASLQNLAGQIYKKRPIASIPRPQPVQNLAAQTSFSNHIADKSVRQYSQVVINKNTSAKINSFVNYCNKNSVPVLEGNLSSENAMNFGMNELIENNPLPDQQKIQYGTENNFSGQVFDEIPRSVPVINNTGVCVAAQENIVMSPPIEERTILTPVGTLRTPNVHIETSLKTEGKNSMEHKIGFEENTLDPFQECIQMLVDFYESINKTPSFPTFC